ncbi:MAG: hypothetical protein FK734_00525 [Asgard group archaeon]|nr:hypothetical protein [Asgard group archaeon]
MSRNKINDMALARETQLMFTYTQGFSLAGNELNRWRGDIIVNTADGERKIPVEVFVPLKYPEYPPRVIVLEKNIQHPNIEKDGNVLLRITHEWKPDVHVYQIIHECQKLFDKVPPKFADMPQKTTKATIQAIDTLPTKNKEVDDVNKTITTLQDKIQHKDEELRKLRSELMKSSNETITKVDNLDMLLPTDKSESEVLVLKAQSVAIADLLSTLDEKFKDGEISPVDFSKLYRKYTKELYLIHKQIENK